MYRYHPEIEGLKCNEDGSEILLNGKVLEIRKMNRKGREDSMLFVNIGRRTHSIGRIVCECWHGLPENPRWCATRRDKDQGYHYQNMYWAPCGTNPQMGTLIPNRSKLSKIKKEDVPEIQERIKKGETLKSIAADYGTSDMSILRIKKQLNKH